MPKARKVFNPLFNIIFNFYTWFVGRKFRTIGKGCSIRPILNVNNPQYIRMGNDVSLGIFCWIGTQIEENHTKPKLTIGNRVHIGAYSMILAADEILIGNNIIMSERVTIVDHIHDYRDVNVPVIDQPIKSTGRIVIENGCFIGINAVITGGVRVGEHSIIGANAVVTRDVPPFTVVGGVPAKIIKRYDAKKKAWV